MGARLRLGEQSTTQVTFILPVAPVEREFVCDVSASRGRVPCLPLWASMRLPDSLPFGQWNSIHSQQTAAGPIPFHGTKAQRDFFSAFHNSLRQGWTGTMQQLSEFLGN